MPVKTMAAAGGVGGGDDLIIADGAAGLDDRRDAALERHLQPVREREERIRGQNSTAPYASSPASLHEPARRSLDGWAVPRPCRATRRL